MEVDGGGSTNGRDSALWRAAAFEMKGRQWNCQQKGGERARQCRTLLWPPQHSLMRRATRKGTVLEREGRQWHPQQTGSERAGGSHSTKAAPHPSACRRSTASCRAAAASGVSPHRVVAAGSAPDAQRASRISVVHRHKRFCESWCKKLVGGSGGGFEISTPPKHSNQHGSPLLSPLLSYKSRHKSWHGVPGEGSGVGGAWGAISTVLEHHLEGLQVRVLPLRWPPRLAYSRSVNSPCDVECSCKAVRRHHRTAGTSGQE